MIQEEMLIVKTADPEPRDRIEAGQLYGKLKAMVERCQTDSAYALVPKPDETDDRRNISDTHY